MERGRHSIRLILTLTCAAAAAHGAEPLYLVKDGKAVATIVRPSAGEQPVRPEKEVGKDGEPTPEYQQKYAEYRRQSSRYRAAVTRPELLRTYVEKMTGARLPVVVEGAEAAREVEGPTIQVGRTKFVEGLNLPFDKMDKHSIVIKRVGDHLVLVGGSGTGTEYAIVTFLEEACGVHWYLPEKQRRNPDPLWTIVPETENLEVGEVDISETPDFLSRDFSIGTYWSEASRWMPRTPAIFFMLSINSMAISIPAII